MSYIHAAKRGTLTSLYRTWEMQHPLRDMLDFLVRGRQLDRRLAVRIVGDWQARTDAAEYNVANKLFDGVVSNGDVRVRATGLGRIVSVELSERMKQQPQEVKNEFIVSAVSQCMNRGREIIQQEALKANDEALLQLYEELERSNNVALLNDLPELSQIFLAMQSMSKPEDATRKGPSVFARQRYEISKETRQMVQTTFNTEDM